MAEDWASGELPTQKQERSALAAGSAAERREVEADWFDDAADIIEREGWIQGTGCTTEGRCLANALGVAAGTENISRAMGVMYRHPAPDRLSAWQPVDWNDNPSRTKQEVLDYLRSTAKALRSEAT